MGVGCSVPSEQPRVTRLERLGLYMMVLLQGWFIVVCGVVENYIPVCHIGVNIVAAG
jgi:hypothetical protein